jgi:hypothetical protein
MVENAFRNPLTCVCAVAGDIFGERGFRDASKSFGAWIPRRVDGFCWAFADGAALWLWAARANARTAGESERGGNDGKSWAAGIGGKDSSGGLTMATVCGMGEGIAGEGVRSAPAAGQRTVSQVVGILYVHKLS